MRFSFSDEQAMIAETVRSFFAEQATSERTRAAMETAHGHDAELWRSAAQKLGLVGLALPEEYGGSGLGQIESAIVAEAAGHQVAALPLLSTALAVRALVAGGTADQRAHWLPKLASGEVIGSYGEGGRIDGGRLHGRIDHVPHGAVAELFVIAAEGGVALLSRDAAVVTLCTSMDQTRPYARIDADGAAVELLADGPAAIDAAMRAGWIALAADALGGAQACLDRTVAYAKERVQFGRAIGSFQAIKHRLADMMVEIEQTRSAVYWAACAADEGAPDALLAAHAAKALAADTYRFCAGNMIQLHGGIGFTWEHDAHLFFKRAQSDATLLGTPEWHRERIAALVGLDGTGLDEAA
ncbi:acyl-CoA dehydrogenase [Rhizorhabdus wittichii DC-6]|nr:acyl-CoA dehydrogenase [Rhizorhabdus wittichii DC-6]